MHQFDDTISQRFFVRITFCAVGGRSGPIWGCCAGISRRSPPRGAECGSTITGERTRVLIWCRTWTTAWRICSYRHRKPTELKMDITAVVSNHVTLQPTATRHNLPFFHLPGSAGSKGEQERRLLEAHRFHAHRAGRPRTLHADSCQTICASAAGRAINIQPLVLPGFKGAKPSTRL